MSPHKWFIVMMCLFVGVPSAAWACGGFFYPDDPMNQTAERIIYSVNGDGTLTVILGIEYEGSAAEFSWLLPVPAVPQVEVVETESLNNLQRATNLDFIPPPHYCSAILSPLDGAGGGGGGIFGTVGPYEYVILGSDDQPDVVAWLRDNGYSVPAQAEPLIEEYLSMGMYFIALRLRPEVEIGAIQPIKLTFEAEQPMIPIKLAAVAASETVPIFVWIFAQTQYQAANYAMAQVDFSQFRGFPAVESLGNPNLSYSDSIADNLYANARTAIQAQYNGQVFITEYAQPSSNLPPEVLADPLLGELANRLPYVTRLRAQLSPEQMTQDILFEPVPDAPDVSNLIDLSQEVANSFEYWGCTTRTIWTEEELAQLPPAHSRLDLLKMDLRHPEGWVLQEFMTADAPTAWTLAPQTVSQADLDALIAGQVLDFPVLLILPQKDSFFYAYELWNIYEPVLGEAARQFIRMRYAPSPWIFYRYSNEVFYSSAALLMLSSSDDLAANHDLYQGMLGYAGSFQYYNHPNLPNTLFLTADRFNEEYADSNVVAVSTPADWRESVQDDGTLLLQPEPASADSPWIRMIPISIENRYQTEITAAQAEALYDLPADTLWEKEFGWVCQGSNSIPFEKDGRGGYIRLTSLYIVEISAPVENVDNDFLFQLSEAIETILGCG